MLHATLTYYLIAVIAYNIDIVLLDEDLHFFPH